MTVVSAAARLRKSVPARSRWLRGDQDMTFVGWLVVVFVGLGAGLIAVQLLLTGYLVPAAATVFLGAGLALTGFKVHRSAVGSARLLAEHRREAARVRASFAELQRCFEARQAEPRTQRATVRRKAGVVTPDEARSWKHFSAALGLGSTVPEPGRRTLRPIAGVVSPELLRVLEGHYVFTPLHPGLVAVELDHAQPTAIVLEESALDRGVWFGALRATGAALFADLRAALSWAKVRHQSIFVLPDPTPRPYSAALRRQATYLVGPGLIANALEADVSLPLLESLREYVSSTTLGASRSAPAVRLAP
jgi:hypothetical protein